MKRWLVLALLATTLAQAAPVHASALPSAQNPLQVQVQRLADDVANAFARRSATFTPVRFEQLPVPTTAADLFPQYGFAPRAGQVGWQLQPLDEDRVRLCLAVTLRSTADWQGYLKALDATALEAATTDCATAAGAGARAMPEDYPEVRFAQRTMDRRRVPTPIVRDEGLTVEKVEVSQVQAITPGRTRIAKVLQAYGLTPSPRMRLKFTNNTLAGPIQVTGAYAPPWVAFEGNTCSVLALGESCTMDLRYVPEPQVPMTAGRAWLEFRLFQNSPTGPTPTGERFEASITLLGMQTRNPVEETLPEAPVEAPGTGETTVPSIPPGQQEDALEGAGCRVPPGIRKKVPFATLWWACATNQWGWLLKNLGS